MFRRLTLSVAPLSLAACSDGPGTSPTALEADFGRERGDGYTANQDADLLNAESKLFHRIDHVLFRDDFTADGRPFRGSVHAERLGQEQDDRTPAGLWPSDHAGVLTTLRTSRQPQ